jgi:hypothetical protein
MEIYLQHDDKGLYTVTVLGKVPNVNELYSKKSLRKGNTEGTAITLEKNGIGRRFYLEIHPSENQSPNVTMTAISNNEQYLNKTLDKIVQDIGFTESFSFYNDEYTHTLDTLKHQALEILEKYWQNRYVKQ